MIAQVLSLILMILRHESNEIVSSVISGALLTIAACGACWLSVIENRRTVYPSTLLTLYLLALVAGDAVQLTAPPYHSKATDHVGMVAARFWIGLAFIATESLDKKSILRKPYQQCSPEETVGVLGRTFFWWINPILLEGNRGIFITEDIPRTDEELSSRALREGMVHAWNQRGLAALYALII